MFYTLAQLHSTPFHSHRILQFKLNATAATTGEDVHPTVPHTNTVHTQEWLDTTKSTRFMCVHCTDMQLNTRLFINAVAQSLFYMQVSTRIKPYFMRAAITVKENSCAFCRKGKIMMENNVPLLFKECFRYIELILKQHVDWYNDLKKQFTKPISNFL